MGIQVGDKRICLVGIIGHMHTGKGVISKFLQLQGFQEIAYATVMKEVMKLLQIPLNRKSLQRFGTDLMRNKYNRDIWIKAFWGRVESTFDAYTALGYPPPMGVVVPDVRFLNERDFILTNHGYTIGVHTSLSKMYERALHDDDKPPPTSMEEFLVTLEHPSEKHIDHLLPTCHFRIANEFDEVSPLIHILRHETLPHIEAHFKARGFERFQDE